MISAVSVASIEQFANLVFDEDEGESTTDGPDVQPANPQSQPSPPQSPSPLPPNSPVLQRTVSETSSIAGRLRVAPVDIQDFVSYMTSKRKTSDMRVEWEVRISLFVYEDSFEVRVGAITDTHIFSNMSLISCHCTTLLKSSMTKCLRSLNLV